MRYRSALILALMLLAAACKPTAPAAETAKAESAATQAVPTQPVPTQPAMPPTQSAPTTNAAALVSGFTKDMPYADLRKRLTDAGWVPVQDPMCRENVGGEARVCSELPEMESCSGDGHCVMHFANAAESTRISISTYGPSDRWNVPGEEGAFAVTSWDLSALDPVAK